MRVYAQKQKAPHAAGFFVAFQRSRGATRRPLKGLLSPALAKRLQAAEAELAALPELSACVRVDDVLRRLPDGVRRFRRMAARLGDAPIDVECGRAALKGLLGPIWIAPRDGYLVEGVFAQT